MLSSVGTDLLLALHQAGQKQAAGNIAEAEEGYEKILEQEPDNKFANQLLGGLALQNGDFHRAYKLSSKALATDPKFLLLDEPFAGVDPIAVEDIQSIISILKKKNIGILITDHNVQETLAITDRTYLMFEGKILLEGVPEKLAEDEMVRKVYLGKNFEFKRKKL